MVDYLAQYVAADWLWLVSFVWALIQAGLLLALVMVSVAVFTWLERKEAGRIQDRLGPTRVGGRFGWLQPLADGIKLFCKEDTVPAAADGLLFRLAPYVSFCASFIVFLAIPFASGWVAQRMDTAVFFILAVAGLEVLGVVLAGYASGSKWSLFGAMREAAQVVSYEVPLALSAVVPVVVAGSMDLVTIGNNQSGMFWNWYIFHDPFTFCAFWIFFTCAVASVNRAPFDLAEAESELVAGFMTEYSGFRWAIFFMAEYGSMLAVSLLAAALFFGGWNGPIPVCTWLGLVPENGILFGTLGHLVGVVVMIAKGCLGVVIMIWARWTLPRLRIDQVMTTCLKYCIPLASAMFAGAVLWMYVFPAGVIFRYVPVEMPAARATSPAAAGAATTQDKLTRATAGRDREEGGL